MSLPAVSRVKNKAVAKELKQIKDYLRDLNVNDNSSINNHSNSHSETGTDTIYPSQIGADTSEQVQAKADEAETAAKDYADTQADEAETAAKDYTDTHEEKANPHSDSQAQQGGTTDDRPSDPSSYEFYFDTDLDKPIWYNGSDWVDATGAVV